MRAIDWRTSSSRSENASAAHSGSTPVFSSRTRLEVRVVERQHAAARVVDEDDLLGAEQVLGDREGADLVVGHHAAGVADHVGVALGQPEDPVRVEAGIHAGQDGDLLGRGEGQVALVERGGVGGGVLEQLVGGRHPASLARLRPRPPLSVELAPTIRKKYVGIDSTKRNRTVRWPSARTAKGMTP